MEPNTFQKQCLGFGASSTQPFGRNYQEFEDNILQKGLCNHWMNIFDTLGEALNEKTVFSK